MRILREDHVRSLVDHKSALDIARSTLRDQAAKSSRLASPSAMLLDASDQGGPRLKFKAATVGHMRMSGIRLLSRRGSNTGPDACVHTALYEHASGNLAGLVSELWLSRIRTAAFGIASVEPLLVSKRVSIGLFGAGDIAAELIPMLRLAFHVESIRVKSRRPEATAAFVRRFEKSSPFAIRAAENNADDVEGADLVFTLTDADEPLVQRGQLVPGAVLCSMGNNCEVSYEVLDEIDRLFVDDPEYASERGDGGAWIAQGHLTPETFAARIDALISEVAGGTMPGRLKSTDRIMAISQGIATGDVAFAAWALQKADEYSLGEMVEI
jgi:ornithine cyclodeaminase/alanine dehydrogenase-like protein (mu-crystallin family)